MDAASRRNRHPASLRELRAASVTQAGCRIDHHSVDDGTRGFDGMDHAGRFKINLSRRYAEAAFRKRCTRIELDGMEPRMSVVLAIRYNMTITSGTTVQR